MAALAARSPSVMAHPRSSVPGLPAADPATRVTALDATPVVEEWERDNRAVARAGRDGHREVRITHAGVYRGDAPGPTVNRWPPHAWEWPEIESAYQCPAHRIPNLENG